MRFDDTNGTKNRGSLFTREQVFWILDHRDEDPVELAKELGAKPGTVKKVINKKTYHAERLAWRIANGEEI